MVPTRRSFLATAALAGMAPRAAAGALATPGDGHERRPFLTQAPPSRFDPWVEVNAGALGQNLATVRRLAGGRPVLAVVKNNAYGLGLERVASVLEPLDGIEGFAVVKVEAALALREAGVEKPILLMGIFSEEDGAALIRNRIDLVLATEDAQDRVSRAARRAGGSPRTHLYLDTGMGRMGIPYYRAMDLLRAWDLDALGLSGAFTAFTEDEAFDPEQLARFRRFASDAADAGIDLGVRHAASSNGVFNFPQSHLDMVRPGIALYGAYPSDANREREIAELRPAVALRARVVRVERLRSGDSVSYGRNYVAREPTWVATVPVGHADGYPRSAVAGSRIGINGQLYPVIGAVSASHTIVELGPDTSVKVGDEATLLGWEDEALYPNAVADSAGVSVYDVLMHLNPSLPRILIG